jgi:hypothetical protein
MVGKECLAASAIIRSRRLVKKMSPVTVNALAFRVAAAASHLFKARFGPKINSCAKGFEVVHDGLQQSRQFSLTIATKLLPQAKA